ncbi:hypothetical protein Tco_1004768 [Tanacetum coccineum]|uniref:Reverse transcriptase N-terminal domain-containing protein n=1 Tax=Tanacetum coccineum TaxID=301880 RepID=A0ABQ5FD43_9ASTR
MTNDGNKVKCSVNKMWNDWKQSNETVTWGKTKIRNKLKSKVILGDVTNEWDAILTRMTTMACNNSIMSVLRTIVIASRVYNIWNERNKRLFENEKRSYGEVLLMIINNVRMKLASLTVKSSNTVDEVSKTWQITINKRKGMFDWGME